MKRTEKAKLEQIADQIKLLSEEFLAERLSDAAPATAGKLRSMIGGVNKTLRRALEGLDPIKHPGVVFDPANPNIMGRFIAITLIAQDRKPLANIERFYGSGVYALYYTGPFPAYSGLSNSEHPLYVGKADPADPASKTVLEQGDRLSRRLNDHKKNITKATQTLRVADFEYRALVVQTGWQSSAEDYLIHLFKPIWNKQMGICYGFGKHGDDPGTRANKRSPWDTLHRGRGWSHSDPSMPDARPEEQIIREISAHLQVNAPFQSVDEILRKFLNEIRAVS